MLCLAQLLTVPHDCLQGAAVAREREGRSLVNSFPFTEARPAKQVQEEPEVNFRSVAAASAGGQRCIDKVGQMMVTMVIIIAKLSQARPQLCWLA